VQIPQETIDNIRDRTDISEIVAQYVELRRTGSNFKGLCPFHEEKTPSFVVSPDKQIYHCFGCGQGGNVFKFLMEIDGVSFPEAVRILGRKCGVEVEYRQISEEDRSKNESRYRANLFAARFYHKKLVSGNAGARARQYLTDRGIPEDAWATHRLGFAPDAWDQMWAAARREGIPNDDLIELKLIIKSDKSKGYFDYFRNRIMFPILSLSGRVIGFGARALGEDAEPKYLNSAESPIFAKRRTFYGVDRARDAIRAKREAVVVEGYTDLISLHRSGVENTVAACGTALTPDHATVLRRMTQRASIVPDGDEAGINAAVSAGAVLLAAGLDVRIVELESGSDPDTAARNLGPEQFGRLIENAVDYFVFLEDIIRERQPTLREREALIERVLAGFSHLDDRLRLDVIAGELARVFEVDPEGLRARQTRRAAAGAASRAQGFDVPTGRRASGQKGGDGRSGGLVRVALERLVLRLILEGTPAALEAIDTLDADDFTDADLTKFYKTLDLARESHIDIRSREFHQKAEEAGLEGLAAEIALIPLPPGNLEILLKDTIRRIKELNIRDELSELRKKLHELPPESEEAVAVAEYFYKLKQALVEL
jgi:DNA primase